MSENRNQRNNNSCNNGNSTQRRRQGGRVPDRKEQEIRARKKAEAKRKKAMKSLILAIILLVLIAVVIVLIVSCGKKKEKPKETEISSETVVIPEETQTESKKVVVNEKPVSLYVIDYGTMTCNKVSSIRKEWSVNEDLEAFGAFATDEPSFEFSSETQAHNDIWNRTSTEKEYKIGYELSFDVDGKNKVITILKPGDIENNPDLYNGDYPEDGDYSGITGYMGAWVYDDMHQDGGFYIHITQAEVTDETLLTSIKLRPTPQSEKIDNLVLKGFSYSSKDEFDSDGHYIGDYASVVKIEKE